MRKWDRLLLATALVFAVGVFAFLTMRAQRGYQRLARAGMVGGVGLASSVPQSEMDLQVLLWHPFGVAWLQRLGSEGTPEGQLYGLVGLCVRDRRAFEALRMVMAERISPVRMGLGCLGSYETTLQTALSKTSFSEESCQARRLDQPWWLLALLTVTTW